MFIILHLGSIEDGVQGISGSVLGNVTTKVRLCLLVKSRRRRRCSEIYNTV